MVPDLTAEELEAVRNNPDYTIYESDSESLTETSEYIFEENTVRSYYIWLTTENLDILDSNPSEEEYVEGAFMHDNKII